MKITNVADVVSMNDMVYIKIMEVTQTDEGRHKVKLSMKYVHQDTGQDLDPDGVLMEEDLFRQRSSSNSNGQYNQGGRRDENIDGTGGANSLLGRSLASNIGMSSAIDPGSLILKGRKMNNGGGTSNSSATFNGYSLVGEDEGELPHDTADTTANKTLREDQTAANDAVRPMGRGRATTLPAWMTRQDNDVTVTGTDERLGSMKDEKGPIDNNNKRRRKYDDDEDESNSNDEDDRHRRKHYRKDRKQRHHRSGRSSRKKHKRHHRDRRRSSRSRSHSYSISSDYDDNSSYSNSRSRSRSPSYKKKKRKNKNKKKRSKHKEDGHHRRDRRDYYSSESSRSRSRSRRKSDKHEGHHKEKEGLSSSGFANVDEARAIMEKLERRQQER